MAYDKPDPALYRIVETTIGRDGRRVRSGQVWQPDLDRTRRFGRVLASNLVAGKIEVIGPSGTVLEDIPLLPEGQPAPGWLDWRAQMEVLPTLPPLPRPAAAQRGRPPALPAAPLPDLPMLDEPFDEMQRTAALPPG